MVKREAKVLRIAKHGNVWCGAGAPSGRSVVTCQATQAMRERVYIFWGKTRSIPRGWRVGVADYILQAVGLCLCRGLKS